MMFLMVKWLKDITVLGRRQQQYSIAPEFKRELVAKMQSSSILIDGSNDTGLEKLKPVTVRILILILTEKEWIHDFLICVL